MNGSERKWNSFFFLLEMQQISFKWNVRDSKKIDFIMLHFEKKYFIFMLHFQKCLSPCSASIIFFLSTSHFREKKNLKLFHFLFDPFTLCLMAISLEKQYCQGYKEKREISLSIMSTFTSIKFINIPTTTATTAITTTQISNSTYFRTTIWIDFFVLVFIYLVRPPFSVCIYLLSDCIVLTKECIAFDIKLCEQVYRLCSQKLYIFGKYMFGN